MMLIYTDIYISMKKVFFDTNIYNHINDEQLKLLKELIARKKVEIYTTAQLLAELAATFKKDKTLGIRYCTIYKDLICKDVLQPPPVLLSTEIGHILNNSRKIIYLEGDNRIRFFRYVEDFVEGIIDCSTQEFIDDMRARKKKQLDFLKQGYLRIKQLVLPENVKKFPTFDSFMKEGDKRKEKLKEIERFLVHNLGADSHKAAKFIKKRLEKAPHLSIALRVTPALTYYYHILGKKPKHGDISDCGFFVCLASVDCFVSDDKEARDLFLLICPKKECLSLNELVHSVA